MSVSLVSVVRTLRRPLLGVSSPQSSTLNSTDSVPNFADRLSTLRSFRKETRRTVTQIFLSIRDAIARTIASQSIHCPPPDYPWLTSYTYTLFFARHGWTMAWRERQNNVCKRHANGSIEMQYHRCIVISD